MKTLARLIVVGMGIAALLAIAGQIAWIQVALAWIISGLLLAGLALWDTRNRG